MKKEASKKTSVPNKTMLLISIFLSISGTFVETDIHVPSFPNMLIYFNTTEMMIQQTVGANFIGMFIGAMIYGPISDAIGRKKVLMFGLGLFVLFSIGCIFSTTIEELLFWRFLQGFGCAAAITVIYAVIFDVFKKEEATQVMVILSALIVSYMAFAPVLGNYLNIYFGWQANFVFIFGLSLLSFIMMGIFYKESLRKDQLKSLNWKRVLKSYWDVASNATFMLNNFYSVITYCIFITFISNLSLILVDHIGVTQYDYGIYQAASMISYIIFSLISGRMIKRLGIEKTYKIGLIGTFITIPLFAITSFLYPNNPVLIVFMINLIFAATAITNPIFATKSMEAVRCELGTASSMSFGPRMIIAAGLVTYTASNFDGSIKPVASSFLIFLGMGIVAGMLYRMRKVA